MDTKAEGAFKIAYLCDAATRGDVERLRLILDR